MNGLSYAIEPMQKITENTSYVWRFQTQEEAEQAARDLALKHNVRIEVFRLVSTVVPTVDICQEPCPAVLARLIAQREPY